MQGRELPRNGVVEDQHAALADDRLADIHVEEVAEPQARGEDRVHHAVDVVGTQIRQAEDADVTLTVDLDELLAMHALERLRVHRLDGTRADAGYVVRRLHRLEQPSTRLAR